MEMKPDRISSIPNLSLNIYLDVTFLFLFVGWMGFYAVLAGNVTGLIMSIFADIFKRRMKLYVLILYTIAAGQ